MDYDETKALSRKAQVCKMPHYCHRREHVMENYYLEEGEENLKDEFCSVCDTYEQRKVATKKHSFLVVAFGISRAYGGPEEGGWWYDITEVIEVRRAFGFKDGFAHAKELRNKHAQPEYNRYSMANHGEPDVYIRCVYSEDDPRMPKETTERPRYE